MSNLFFTYKTTLLSYGKDVSSSPSTVSTHQQRRKTEKNVKRKEDEINLFSTQPDNTGL